LQPELRHRRPARRGNSAAVIDPLGMRRTARRRVGLVTGVIVAGVQTHVVCAENIQLNVQSLIRAPSTPLALLPTYFDPEWSKYSNSLKIRKLR
jgi:hypothetical protein